MYCEKHDNEGVFCRYCDADIIEANELQKEQGIMGNNNMAVYQFSNAELERIKQALAFAAVEAEDNPIGTAFNAITNTINQILAARNSRGN